MIVPVSTTAGERRPRVSMVVLNLNGRQWLERCFDSLKEQTIFEDIEVVFADNASTDGSAEFAEEVMNGWPNGVFVQHGENLGFCEGNNRAADFATSDYVMFINNDMWLEPDCLEKLLEGVEAEGADGGTPVLENYEDDTFQGIGATGLDLFGLSNACERPANTRELFAIAGGSCMMKAELFRKIGGFDHGHFMYGEEADLCWRVWISGGRLVGVPSARIHHRTSPLNSAVQTTERKRFLSTRNGLLMLLKNSQHLFFLLLVPNIAFRFCEAIASVILLRRFSFFRNVFLAALVDCWRMRGHVAQWRRRIRTFRRRGDFWLLRFLRLKPAVWPDVVRLIRHGIPTVERK